MSRGGGIKIMKNHPSRFTFFPLTSHVSLPIVPIVPIVPIAIGIGIGIGIGITTSSAGHPPCLLPGNRLDSAWEVHENTLG
jgi:hypothetical protein